MIELAGAHWNPELQGTESDWGNLTSSTTFFVAGDHQRLRTGWCPDGAVCEYDPLWAKSFASWTLAPIGSNMRVHVWPTCV